MNHSGACAGPSFPARAVRTPRLTPSAPLPAPRPAIPAGEAVAVREAVDPFGACAGASMPARAVRTARITPSAPIPARRSASATTAAASRSSSPSGSSRTTKSFSVPWPLVKRRGEVMAMSLCRGGRAGRTGAADLTQGPPGQVPRLDVEPPHPGIATEPRVLSADQAAGGGDGGVDGRPAVQGTVQDRRRLFVADRAAGGAAAVQALLTQLPHILHPALLDQ